MILTDVIGLSMVIFGSFSLGWYLRRPPVYGRIVGAAGRRCNDEVCR